MVRRTAVIDPYNWLYGLTLFATVLASVALAGVAVYCAWLGLRIPATHAAFASAIVMRRVRQLVLSQ